MTAVSYLARVAATGTVAGFGIGASLEQIREALGAEGVADRRKKSLRLDYGLLEFAFYAGSCENIAIQVHRLSHGREGLIPNSLLELLEGISDRIRFDDLRAEIKADFASLEEMPRQVGYRCYRVVGTHVRIYVVEEASPDDVIRPGDLWAIMISKDG